MQVGSVILYGFMEKNPASRDGINSIKGKATNAPTITQLFELANGFLLYAIHAPQSLHRLLEQ
jgi:hypothetical protein